MEGERDSLTEAPMAAVESTSAATVCRRRLQALLSRSFHGRRFQSTTTIFVSSSLLSSATVVLKLVAASNSLSLRRRRWKGKPSRLRLPPLRSAVAGSEATTFGSVRRHRALRGDRTETNHHHLHVLAPPPPPFNRTAVTKGSMAATVELKGREAMAAEEGGNGGERKCRVESTEPSRAELSRAESDRAEPSRTGPPPFSSFAPPLPSRNHRHGSHHCRRKRRRCRCHEPRIGCALS